MHLYFLSFIDTLVAHVIIFFIVEEKTHLHYIINSAVAEDWEKQRWRASSAMGLIYYPRIVQFQCHKV